MSLHPAHLYWKYSSPSLLILPILLFIGLAVKLLLIGHLIHPGPFPPTRVPVLATVGILAIFAIPFTYLSLRARLWGALALNAAGTTVALVDQWHFRFYEDLPSLADINGLWQLGIAASSLPALVHRTDFAAIADIVFVAACAAFVRHYPANDRRRYRPALVCGMLSMTSVVAVLPVLRIAHQDPDEVFEYSFERKEVLGAVGLAGYHVYDLAVNVLRPLRGRLATGHADVLRIAETLKSRNEQRFSSRLTGVARGLNIIVLSAESVQASVLGLTIDGQEVAPNLTAFARESLHFTRFFDQTHRGTTADAQFLSMNSLMPLQFGAVATRYSSNDFRALPGVLNERGYRTLSACGEPGSFWNMGRMHQKIGFARSLFAPDFHWTRWVGVGLDDASFFEQLVPTLRAEREPFFAFLISSSNHHPYRLPTELRRLRPGSLPDGIAGDYLQSVRYFDEAFGKLVADLASAGVLDRTMFVVYGDHQSWVEDADLQRLWKASGHDRDATPFELWQFRRRVPLFIRLPHASESGVRDTPGGHLDVTPTLLSLLGIDDVTGPWLGRDLTAPSRNIVAFRDGSVTDDASTLIRGANGEVTCYARSGDQIPCEWIEPLAEKSRALLATSDTMIAGNLARPVTVELAREPRKPIRSLGRVLVIAHRGDSVHYPENTLESIRAAFELGADAVEVDVRLSRDGVPMIFHDDTLERTTNGRGPFERLSLREAKALDAGSWKAPRFANARIPTLEEAVRAAHGRGTLLLDLKVQGLAAAVRAAYDRVGAKPEDAIIGSWPPSQWSEFLRRMPRARLLNTDDAPLVWGEGLFEDMRRQGIWGFELGDYWPPPFIGDAALHGMPVIAYTVNDEPTLRRLIEAGVSGIETDDPALLLHVAANLRAR